MSKQVIYMDHEAATPLDPNVLKAMLPYFAQNYYNPSATYVAGRQVHNSLEAARASIALWFGARPSEVIFTAGATEANNLAIHGVMRRYPKANIVVSSIEHESVLAPAAKYDCHQVKSQPDGRIDLEDLANKIDNNTVLVSIMYANNEIGTIEPIREISKIIEKKRTGRKELPLFFHTDAAQAANYLDLHVARLGVDLLSINGGKLYGPKQSGALYIRAGTELEPLIQGGNQEHGLRSGTENVAASIGLAKALDIAQKMRREETARLFKLQQLFIKLTREKLPDVEVNGSQKYRLPNNVHLTLAGRDNERLIIQLDEANILAAAGSACSASNVEPSHVLKAIGLTTQQVGASLRFTMGRDTDLEMVRACILELEKLA